MSTLFDLLIDLLIALVDYRSSERFRARLFGPDLTGSAIPDSPYCPGCGREFEAEDIFCGHCGAVLRVDLPRPATGQPARPDMWADYRRRQMALTADQASKAPHPIDAPHKTSR